MPFPDPTLVFNLLAITAGTALFLLALALCALAWWRRWIMVKRVSASVVVVLLLSFVAALYLHSDAVEFPFLQSPPVEADLPGTYSLYPDSAQMLADLGYAHSTAQIILRPDKTYEIRNMPHLWLYGREFRPGNDTCFGTWKTELPIGTTAYDVGIQLDRFTDDSAYVTDTNKGFGTLHWVPIGIAAKTKWRTDYALAVPLNNGDGGEIIFVKDQPALQ